MELVIAYLLVNIAVGAVACFFGKRLFYIMLAAIVFLAVGPWPLIVIAVFVFVGVAAGQVLDGDPKIVNTLRHLFNRNSQ